MSDRQKYPDPTLSARSKAASKAKTQLANMHKDEYEVLYQEWKAYYLKKERMEASKA